MILSSFIWSVRAKRSEVKLRLMNIKMERQLMAELDKK